MVNVSYLWQINMHMYSEKWERVRCVITGLSPVIDMVFQFDEIISDMFRHVHAAEYRMDLTPYPLSS